MASVNVVSGNNLVFVDFGDYASGAVPVRGAWRKDEIVSVVLLPGSAGVQVKELVGFGWLLQYSSGVGVGLPIGSINSGVPSSNADLYDKLTAIFD